MRRMSAGTISSIKRVEARGADRREHVWNIFGAGTDMPGFERVQFRLGCLRDQCVWWTIATSAPYADGIEQARGFVRRARLEPDHPCLVRRLVHRLGMRVELTVDRDDFTGDRRVQLGHGLDRLDGAERLALFDSATDFGKLDEHDVAELPLGEIGDPDEHVPAVLPQPLVIFRVLQVCWKHSSSAQLAPKLSTLGGVLRSGSCRTSVTAASCRTAPPRRPHRTRGRGRRFEAGADRRQLHRHHREADRLLQKRRLRAARHDAARRAVRQHRIAVASNRAFGHLERDQLSREPAGLLRPQRRVTRGNGPFSSPRSSRGPLRAPIVCSSISVPDKSHAGFEAQRVARAKAAGANVRRSCPRQ